MSDLPEINLLFVSGSLDSSIWRQQEKYFSRNCNVELVGGGTYREVKSEVEQILEKEEDFIVVGGEFGNAVVKSVESNENIVSTVFTGPFDDIPKIGGRKYGLMKKVISKPKLFRKIFFQSGTEYSIVKKFLNRIELPSYEVFDSYYGFDLEVPLKNSLVIYNQECRFSTMGKVEELRPNSEIALLNAGTFSFYEKPQEFNKALHDYLLGKKDFLEKRELVKAASNNRSLNDFNELKRVRKER
jgi:hypothetical protein